MTEEEIREFAREYIDSCTKRAGFVILNKHKVKEVEQFLSELERSAF